MIETSPQRRGVVARIGITLLNVVPGLGLIRLNDVGGFWWLLPNTALNLVFNFGMARAPVPTFTSFAIFVGVGVVLAMIFIAGSMMATWRRSATTFSGGGWWSRWYGIVVILAGLFLIASAERDLSREVYRSFYAAGESSLPTLLVNDRFLVDLRHHALHRGELIVVRRNNEDWIKRIIGLPGDRVALRGGVPVINGVAATRHRVGTMAIPRQSQAVRFTETLPGATRSYEVLDSGATAQDDIPEVVVPAGHLFLLGDNRDNSEDSRFPTVIGGLGMVPESDVVGRPLFIFWSRDRGRIGRSLLGD